MTSKTFNLGKVIGPEGSQGEPGKKAVMKIGTVETATEDKQPNVTIESSDDEENSYTLGFVLPQGGGESSVAKEDITLSTETESVELSPSSATATVVISGVQTENVTIVCSDEEVATVSQSYNGDTKTLQLTIVSDVNGDAEVTVVDNGDEHYNKSNTVTINVTSSEFSPIYGVEWDSTATPFLGRTNDSLFFVDPTPYRKGLPSSTPASSPFDEIAPWSGMVQSDRAGGKMVAIPRFWYKLTQNGDRMKIQISPTKREGYHVSPAHMDRDDGAGERETIYVGRYHCSTDNYKSISGLKPKASVNRETARTEIHKLGNNVWLMDFATRFTIWLLYLVEFADWGSQRVIGYGTGPGTGVTAEMGYTDEMPYHTGTMLSSRTTYDSSTQYRNIEGLWDNIFDVLGGCYYDANRNFYIILNPSNDNNELIDGVHVGVISASWTRIVTFDVKNIDNMFPVFIPAKGIGSNDNMSDIGSCDNWESSYSTFIKTGGSYAYGKSYGMFHMSTCGVTTTSSNYGYRLIELP